MQDVRKNDFGVAPLYAMSGRPANEQAVLLWVWNHALSGTSWTLKSLSIEAGVSTSVLPKLLAAVDCIAPIPEGEREGTKKSAEFAATCPMLPDRDRETKAAKGRTQMPPWVFRACRVWADRLGVVVPKIMMSALDPAVKMHNEERTLEALGRYVSAADARFSPSPFKFAQSINRYLKNDQPMRSRSMTDVLAGEDMI